MKTEIETRFLEIDVEKFIQKLHELGAQEQSKETCNDIIFYDEAGTWHAEGRLVRLRTRGGMSTLTYKQSKRGVTGTREVEFQITDTAAAQSFVEALGLVAYRRVEKRRQTFNVDGVSVDIDSWPRIPPYVELEGDSVEALQKVAAKLGLDWEARCDETPFGVYKKYGYDLDTIHWLTFDRFE